MSQALLRYGLWLVLIVLAMYVLRETFPESEAARALNDTLLQRAGLAGLGMIAVGFVLNQLERVWDKTKRSRCIVCGAAIRRGDIYCREHLRQVLDQEREASRKLRRS
jgi:hypothetical protein